MTTYVIETPRYSNLDPGNYNVGSFGSYGGLGGLSGGSSGTGASGSGLFSGADITGLINSGLSTIENVTLGLWGKGDRYKVQALQMLNAEQKKTTYILFAIIGVVLVLAAFLIIRKK